MTKYAKETVAYLEETLNRQQNFDIVKRQIGKRHKKATMYFLSSVIDNTLIARLIITIEKSLALDSVFYYASDPNITKVTDLDKLVLGLYNGETIVIFDHLKEAYLCDTRGYPNRSVSEPEVEKSVRGSRDGFNESIIVNVGLIRRRIKDPSLRVENYLISSKSKCNVALLYLEDQANSKIISSLQERLKKLDLNSLIMTDRALEENLFAQNKTIFPLVRYTERPDVASINILNGKALIICDTSSSAIITPCTIIDHTKHVEEYRQNPLIGSFTRLLRTIAVLLSVFLLPVWFCIVKDNTYINLTNFHVSGESSSPLVVQILTASLLIEIFRIAIIHTPSSLVSALSLIAAIILGEVSMKLGLFLPEILLFVAISAICGFATPSYELSLTNKVVQLALIIIVALFSMTGFVIALILLFLYLVQIKTFEVPYLSPLIPFSYKDIKSVFIREAANNKKNV